MNHKLLAIIVAILLFAVCLSACNNNPSASSQLDSPSLAPAVTPAVSSGSSASSSAPPSAMASVAPVETPDPQAPLDSNFINSFKDLATESSIVIRGEFVKKMPDLYNSLRSMDDATEPDPVYFIEQEQHEYKITAVYKNDSKLKTPLKAGDTIIVNTPFNDLYTSDTTPKKDPKYMKITLNQNSVLFLTRFDFNPEQPVYQPETDVYCFNVKDDKLFATSYDEKYIEQWNENTKGAEGIPVANLKRDLEVK